MSVTMVDKVRAAETLPSLPGVAVEILELTRSETASVSDIARVIEHDPALTSKILKVANSALFGMARQVSSVHQAIVILGLRTVKVMALTFSLVEAVQDDRPGGFDYQSFWRRSLTSAVAGRVLAGHVRSPRAEEIFIGALLSDIGMLAAFHADKATYRQVLADHQSSLEPIQVLEQRHLGATHAEFSGQLLDAWGLPAELVRAITHHHQDPRQLYRPDSPADELDRAVAAAALIADLFCAADGPARLDDVRTHVPRLLPISEDDLEQVLKDLQVQVQETASKWAIDIGAARSYKEIQAEAVVQLARLTMAAELERAHLAAREQELHTQNRTLARKATTDGLTGIANRIAFEEHLAKVCTTARAHGHAIGMLLLDIDRFKKLNDTFGHQAGDAALRCVGEYLQRLNDTRRLAARYGGEEFAVVVVDPAPDELRCLAEQIRLEIQQSRIFCHDQQIRITVSIGGAVLDPACPELEPADLIARADKCLYRAKQTGRNRAICDETAHPSVRPGHVCHGTAFKRESAGRKTA
ncbi:MAG TPA: GGDEF domain-containing protein [Phycisphaerae bacterium]|nr:GGDEF domain-containing protein [Phycisphaerae bacterium]HOJ74538.1 GGDEF domain-containing protein [Phycisphaerae bacterium]HOM52739.1 GGDEF domain-containing protein [Phycisphaerae bacterium]HON66209.1 GGDEF domain-containing protein [Phycisphaerae bacterium]HOQ88296.1 GGDEF domain-containing protein [Phycisphaerae bacterium]